MTGGAVLASLCVERALPGRAERGLLTLALAIAVNGHVPHRAVLARRRSGGRDLRRNAAPAQRAVGLGDGGGKLARVARAEAHLCGGEPRGAGESPRRARSARRIGCETDFSIRVATRAALARAQQLAGQTGHTAPLPQRARDARVVGGDTEGVAPTTSAAQRALIIRGEAGAIAPATLAALPRARVARLARTHTKAPSGAHAALCVRTETRTIAPLPDAAQPWARHPRPLSSAASKLALTAPRADRGRLRRKFSSNAVNARSN